VVNFRLLSRPELCHLQKLGGNTCHRQKTTVAQNPLQSEDHRGRKAENAMNWNVLWKNMEMPTRIDRMQTK
jgi:hypothetical protein